DPDGSWRDAVSLQRADARVDDRQPVSVRIWQWAPEDGVHDAEHRDARPDTQRQRGDDNHGKDPDAPKRADSEDHVSRKSRELIPGMDGKGVFLHRLDAAYLEERRSASLRGWQPGVQVFLGQELEKPVNLVIDVAMARASLHDGPQEAFEARRELARRVLAGHDDAARGTRFIAATRRSHVASSRSSCRRPARVRRYGFTRRPAFETSQLPLIQPSCSRRCKPGNNEPAFT